MLFSHNFDKCFQHLKRNFVSLCGHVMSSIKLLFTGQGKQITKDMQDTGCLSFRGNFNRGAPMSTGNPSAPGSKPPPTAATPEGCTNKTATGPTRVKTAPLKSKSGEIITDQSQQLQRWVEHYLELYATQNIVTDTALNALPSLPVMEELDDLSTEGELSKAIDSLACGKAPGKDGIPPELLKQGKSTLLQACTSCCAFAGNKDTSPKT